MTPSPAGGSRPTRPRAASKPSPPAAGIPVGCAPMTPSPAGATTPTGRPTRPRAASKPSPPAGSIPVGCAPMTPSPAGAGTPTGRPTRPRAASKPSPPAAGIPAGSHQHLLGQQLPRGGRRALGQLQSRHRRRAYLWAAHRQHHHMLGRQLRTGRPTRPRAASKPSPPAAGIPAGCAPMTPSPAGGSRPTRPRAASKPSPPACIPAGCAPMTPSLLGQQRLRAGRRALGQLQSRHRRRRAFLWAAHRRHHHMLGQQLPRGGRRALGQLQSRQWGSPTRPRAAADPRTCFSSR